MQKIEDVTITVYVSTNEGNYIQQFPNIEEAKEYLDEIINSIKNSND